MNTSDLPDGCMNELSETERVAYEAIKHAAERCEPCPKNEDLAALISFESLGGTADLVSRLELKGLIEVQRFQRSRQVRIVETDKWTARPLNCAPHWRDRPKDMPTPAQHAIRQREPSIAQQIEKWASERRMSFSDALADLVFVGWEVERERG